MELSDAAGLDGLSPGVAARLCALLDANGGRAWRGLARAHSLREDELEIGEPGPSARLLSALGARGVRVSDLARALGAMGHDDTARALGQEPVFVEWCSESQQAWRGESVTLGCRARGNPPPRFTWFHGKHEIPDAVGPELLLASVLPRDAGHYTCRVHNEISYGFTDWIRLRVLGDQTTPEKRPGPVEHSEATGATQAWGPQSPSQSPFLPLDAESSSFQTTFYATEKVALVIGNLSYRNHTALRAPLVDARDLTSLLRVLDFRVVTLIDLDLQHMRLAVARFLELLDEGVYGLLYFAGHGFENYGQSYLVPVDAPRPYLSEHALSATTILRGMQARRTGLNVLLLDMCRKRNVHECTVPPVETLEVTANIVFGYATCQDAEAYELDVGPGEKAGVANGLFMRFLKERLLEDRKVTAMLDSVAEDMGRCNLARGRQALEIRSSLSERRALTDPRRPAQGFPARSIYQRWAQAHELPPSRTREFDSGCLVHLGFAAEFSNVLMIYARVLERGAGVVSCRAYVTDLPDELEVDAKISNLSSLEVSGSVGSVPHRPAEPCFSTRVTGLQHLRGSLTFSIVLECHYGEMDIMETWALDIGTPLAAQLGSALPPHTPNLTLPASPISPLARPAAPFTDCAIRSPSLPSSAGFGVAKSPGRTESWSWGPYDHHHAGLVSSPLPQSPLSNAPSPRWDVAWRLSESRDGDG
ncbi:mucosa-associated lymphoid tissue lymphoma translocation protein 1-like isoform X2 [Lampetra fluviatilis]